MDKKTVCLNIYLYNIIAAYWLFTYDVNLLFLPLSCLFVSVIQETVMRIEKENDYIYSGTNNDKSTTSKFYQV